MTRWPYDSALAQSQQDWRCAQPESMEPVCPALTSDLSQHCDAWSGHTPWHSCGTHSRLCEDTTAGLGLSLERLPVNEGVGGQDPPACSSLSQGQRALGI